MSTSRRSAESRAKDDPVPIHLTKSQVEAEALAARLTSAGFPVIVRSANLAAGIYLGDYTAMQQYYVMVPRSRAVEARAAVEQLLRDAE